MWSVNDHDTGLEIGRSLVQAQLKKTKQEPLNYESFNTEIIKNIKIIL